MDYKSFDLEFLKPGTVIRLRHGEALLGKNGVLTPLLTAFLKAALEIEFEAHQGVANEANRKNRIEILRGKLHRQITALHARGGKYSDIRNHLGEIYEREGSTATIRKVFAKHKSRAPNDKRKIR